MTPAQRVRMWRAEHEPMAAVARTIGRSVDFAVRGSSTNCYRVSGQLRCSCPDGEKRLAPACKHCCLVARLVMENKSMKRWLVTRKVDGLEVRPRNTDCCLCLEGLASTDCRQTSLTGVWEHATIPTATCLGCRQGYHLECLTRWTRVKEGAIATCPICRTKLPSTELLAVEHTALEGQRTQLRAGPVDIGRQTPSPSPAEHLVGVDYPVVHDSLMEP